MMMSKGLPRSLANAASSTMTVVRVPVDTTIDITGVADAVDAGTAVIAGLPEGNLFIMGLVGNFVIDAGADAHVIDAWTGDFALGLMPNEALTFDSGDGAELSDPAAITAAGGTKAVPNQKINNDVGNGVGMLMDNTDGTLEVNFNLLVDDNVITDGEVGSFRVTGSIHMAYFVLGDD